MLFPSCSSRIHKRFNYRPNFRMTHAAGSSTVKIQGEESVNNASCRLSPAKICNTSITEAEKSFPSRDCESIASEFTGSHARAQLLDSGKVDQASKQVCRLPSFESEIVVIAEATTLVGSSPTRRFGSGGRCNPDPFPEGNILRSQRDRGGGSTTAAAETAISLPTVILTPPPSRHFDHLTKTPGVVEPAIIVRPQPVKTQTPELANIIQPWASGNSVTQQTATCENRGRNSQAACSEQCMVPPTSRMPLHSAEVPQQQIPSQHGYTAGVNSAGNYHQRPSHQVRIQHQPRQSNLSSPVASQSSSISKQRGTGQPRGVGSISQGSEGSIQGPHPTPLFQRLVSEEVQELKSYARIIESQNRRLAELERVHGDLEARLEIQSTSRMEIERTLEDREQRWAEQIAELEKDREHWKSVVEAERTKNARLMDRVVRKDQDIHRMLQRKVSLIYPASSMPS